MSAPIRIAIDAREMSKPQRGGFKSYLTRLVGALAEADPENEYVFYFDREVDENALSLPKRRSIKIIGGNRIAADFFGIPAAIREDRPDVVHFPCNYGIPMRGVKQVVTLHDTICLEGAKPSGIKSRLLSYYNAGMIHRSVLHADAALTVSEYSRNRILSHFPSMEGRITVTYLAGTLDVTDGGSLLQNRFSGELSEPCFLVMASVDPRKNVHQALAAFARSQARVDGCRLLIVSSHANATAYVESYLREYGLGDEVSILADVSDSELLSLYKGCLAYVFASLEEGFGLPPLEAMSAGACVLSSEASVMPEVLHDGALFFDPNNADDIAVKMNAVWSSPALRDELRERGLRVAQSYSWSKTAQETLDVYRRVAGE